MPRGRPKIEIDDQRRKLASAGRQLFIERGYANTTTDLLAVRSIVSKRTVYELIEDKADLLKSILKEQGPRLLPVPRWRSDEPLETALERLFLLRDDENRQRDISDLLLIRAAWDAAPYVPEIRAEFSVSRSEISAWFQDLRRAGRISDGDSLVTTTMLLGALFGGLAIYERERDQPLDPVIALTFARRCLKSFAMALMVI